MAARTLESGYYGSVGLGNPESSFEDVTLRVAWDFGKKAVPENKTIPLMQLPKGLLIDRISVVQTKALNSAATLTFGLASDDTLAVGGNFALVASGDLLRSSQDADATDNTSLYVAADDILCMIVPDGITGDELNAGAFDVCLKGCRVFAEQLTANPLNVEAYRAPLQTTNNVSGGQWPID